MIDTRVIPDVASPGKYVAQYYDETIGTWFDIGDPKDTEQEARAAANAHGRSDETPTTEAHPLKAIWGPLFEQRTRYVISADGTMIPASDARVIELDETLAKHLLDVLDGDDRASYAFQHGQEI